MLARLALLPFESLHQPSVNFLIGVFGLFIFKVINDLGGLVGTIIFNYFAFCTFLSSSFSVFSLFNWAFGMIHFLLYLSLWLY
jgi:hypothetical protein